MRLLKGLCLILLFAASSAMANPFDDKYNEKMATDYLPISKLCSDQNKTDLGHFVGSEDDRCMGHKDKYCFHTMTGPIGAYQFVFENGTCNVRVNGTSIREYEAQVICQTSAQEILCGGSVQWAKPQVSLVPRFIRDLVN